MAGFVGQVDSEHGPEKSNVNVYVEGEQEHGACPVALPENRKHTRADAYSIQYFIVIVIVFVIAIVIKLLEIVAR